MLCHDDGHSFCYFSSTTDLFDPGVGPVDHTSIGESCTMLCLDGRRREKVSILLAAWSSRCVSWFATNGRDEKDDGAMNVEPNDDG